MTERPVNHEANRGSLSPLALRAPTCTCPGPQSHSPTIFACVRCLHASHAGRREYSVSGVLSEVPLSVRGARPLRKASGRYARRRARAARYVRRR
jgi:hypothetical protein